MIERLPITDEQITLGMLTDYGIEVATLNFLPIGADNHANLFKATTLDGSSYFIKIRRESADEANVMTLAFLDSVGIKQIIPILKTRKDHATSTIDSFTIMVFPFIEGQNGFNRDLTESQWATLGQVMKQIHGLTVPPATKAKIRREQFSPRWREAVRFLYQHIDLNLKGDVFTINFILLLRKLTPAINHMLARAELLAKKIQAEPPEYVLCHSDLHGGNVLIDANEQFYIVDWDEPIMAPKERDLMFIGGGVGNVWNKPHEEVLFYQGYGQAEINKSVLTYYRYERIIEDIAIYGQQLLLNNEQTENRIEIYKHFSSQFEPNGVVEIALRTDDVKI